MDWAQMLGQFTDFTMAGVFSRCDDRASSFEVTLQRVRFLRTWSGGQGSRGCSMGVHPRTGGRL